MEIAVLGIDLGKNSCSVVGLDGGGKVVLRRLSRDGVVKLASSLPRCVTATEAGCGARHLGRTLLGHPSGAELGSFLVPVTPPTMGSLAAALGGCCPGRSRF